MILSYFRDWIDCARTGGRYNKDQVMLKMQMLSWEASPIPGKGVIDFHSLEVFMVEIPVLSPLSLSSSFQLIFPHFHPSLPLVPRSFHHNAPAPSASSSLVSMRSVHVRATSLTATSASHAKYLLRADGALCGRGLVD